MKLHLFCSIRDPDIFGLTENEAGANLPDVYAPWEHFGKRGVIPVEARQKSMGRLLEPVVETVKRSGYYLGRGRH